MLSNMVTNELFLRNNLIDIKTGNKVEQSFNGYPINTYKTAQDKFILNDRLTNSVVYNPPSKKSKSDHFLIRLGLKK